MQCKCNCGEVLGEGRSDRLYVNANHRQAAYRRRQAERRAARRRRRHAAAERAAKARRLDEHLLRALEAAQAKPGDIWLRAGGQLWSLTEGELAETVEAVRRRRQAAPTPGAAPPKTP